MFGLVEGNNFYASCERVFQPAPRGVPLVVLSNNDGCAIARSAEAKALGIQQDLFAPAVAGDRKLMETLDQINRKFGRGVAGLGASGWKDKPDWGMRQHMLSPNYTTSVHELPRARC